MNPLLRQLARDGDISWLSYYFAEFVSQRDGSSMDALAVLSAALVSEASLAGHVCVDLEQYRGRALFTASRPDESEVPLGPAPDAWCEGLRASGCVGDAGDAMPMILDGLRLYLNRYWHYEDRVARIVTAMLEREPDPDPAQNGVDAETLFANQPGIDADQLRAVHAAAGSGFSVISGGPGSGKTSTVIRILALLRTRNPNQRIALAAPTGKAAARMMDSIRARLATLDIDADIKAALPLQAQTLHRLLGYRRQSFTYHAERHLPVDCVVVDEASMIDLKLMYHLLAALPPNAQLILLGDRDQLASVAAGNVLGDITGHGHRISDSTRPIAAATRLLRNSYRFGHDSAIGELAQRVRGGEPGEAIELLRSGDRGLAWLEVDAASDADDRVEDGAVRWILDAYQPVFDCASPAEALDVYERTRLLCVTNRGPLGIDELNQRISSALLARNQQAPASLFHGLPIMITRNLHELGLFNGDTGILWSFDGELRACFRDPTGTGNTEGIRDLAINRVADFKPAWTIAVHKSQGSEFDSVLLLLPTEAPGELLSRELLYTGITRARSEFRLQASRATLGLAITRITRRHSGLAARLGWPDSDTD